MHQTSALSSWFTNNGKSIPDMIAVMQKKRKRTILVLKESEANTFTNQKPNPQQGWAMLSTFY